MSAPIDPNEPQMWVDDLPWWGWVAFVALVVFAFLGNLP